MLETVGQYRILSKLGEGGMGEVFLAEDSRLRRKVALKILLPEVAQDPDRLARFLQEARAASALSHPNAAHIYEVGESGGSHYLAMEYIEGETLESRLTGEPLPLAGIVAIAGQVAEALDAAHARGIVHRDIKPANLMVGPRGHVTVLDFGLAKFLPESGDASSGGSQIATQFMTSGGVVMGTVAYMSPEQALGRAVDHRTDLFSLGVVIYRMATGRLPFAGGTPQETLARILEGRIEAIARLNYEVPEAFESIVRKCLDKDRDRRYQSARELQIDLQNLTRSQEERKASGPLRAVIVDDEELARGLLREYLRAAGGVEVVAECANGFEAVKAASEHKPDLVFLDVQMPKLDGFEVLELIDPSVSVIFVTAYDQYAMKAFDANAVDYLLKPFSADRFKKALDRVRLRFGSPTPPRPQNRRHRN